MKILRVLGHCLLGVSCLILSSCPELWGPMDNSVDPRSESYQGFLTETDPDAVAPASTDAGVVTYIPTLVSSNIIDDFMGEGFDDMPFPVKVHWYSESGIEGKAVQRLSKDADWAGVRT